MTTADIENLLFRAGKQGWNSPAWSYTYGQWRHCARLHDIPNSGSHDGLPHVLLPLSEFTVYRRFLCRLFGEVRPFGGSEISAWQIGEMNRIGRKQEREFTHNDWTNLTTLGRVGMSKSKGELESQISKSLTQWEKGYLGRGSLVVKTDIMRNMIIVMLKGILTPAEQKLTETPEGMLSLKNVRDYLVEVGNDQLREIVAQLTGSEIVSFYTDLSTRTGERIMVFVLSDAIHRHKIYRQKLLVRIDVQGRTAEALMIVCIRGHNAAQPVS
jgi:uncharacterized protein YbcI